MVSGRIANGGGPPSSLELHELAVPQPKDYELQVRIKACSVNPVDTKIRQGKFPASDITGYDAAGIVTALGSKITGFQVGDEVIYAGALGIQGSTAQYGVVDYRIAAPKPKGWDWADASAIPLVNITAWEMFADHFGIDPRAIEKNSKESILIINGAGGVGSAATQLARNVFGLKNVIVTASRPETIAHAKQLGETHVVDHQKELKPQLDYFGIKGVRYVMICHSTPQYIEQACAIASTWGKIGSIVECEEPLQFQSAATFAKALSFSWEFMFANATSGDDAMLRHQGGYLRDISRACEDGRIRSTVTQTFDLSVASLRKAHEILESGKAIGKISLVVGEDVGA